MWPNRKDKGLNTFSSHARESKIQRDEFDDKITKNIRLEITKIDLFLNHLLLSQRSQECDQLRVPLEIYHIISLDLDFIQVQSHVTRCQVL